MVCVAPVFMYLPLIYSGTSTFYWYIVLYALKTFLRSVEPGAYDKTASFLATGTLKNPFPMV